jgi:2-oxoglutarate ferredoxin oxidoreductase subunit delta
MFGGDKGTASESVNGPSKNGASPTGNRADNGGSVASDGSPAAEADRTAVPAKSTDGQARRWNYPSAEEHPDEEVFVHRKWCKSCGICYSMCPKGVIVADKAGRPIVARPEDCIVCGLCEMLCPDMAITVHKKRQKSGVDPSSGRASAERDGKAKRPEPGND